MAREKFDIIYYDHRVDTSMFCADDEEEQKALNSITNKDIIESLLYNNDFEDIWDGLSDEMKETAIIDAVYEKIGR